jgi:hypothetical protein
MCRAERAQATVSPGRGWIFNANQISVAVGVETRLKIGRVASFGDEAAA